MKVCSKCCEQKSLEGFYSRPNGKDGKHAECKDCMKERSREWAEKYPSEKRLRKRELEKIRRAKNKEESKLYQSIGRNSLHPEQLEKYTKRCSLKIKIIARTMVNSAIQKGWLIKPLNCEICKGEGLLHGHHNDYGEPLDIRWVCPKCHAKIERG